MSDDTTDVDETLAKAVKLVELALRRWPEQYKRMVRWRVRLDGPSLDADLLRDEFYAFFLAAFHLADWIKRDDTVDQTVRDAAWKLRHAGTLALAADVANGFKHLKLTPGRGKAAHVSVYGTFPVEEPELPQAEAAQTQPQWLGVVVVDQEPEDAYEVADRCVAEWDTFLRQHGLNAE